MMDNSIARSVDCSIKPPIKNGLLSLLFSSVLLFIILGGMLPGVAFSASEDEQKKLETLKTQIQQLQNQLSEENRQKDHAVYQLQQAEKEVALASSKLRKTEKDLGKSQQKLTALKEEEQKLQHKFSENRKFLVKQIRAAYSIGKQEYVKLLLNQEDPATVSRMVTYYQYFNKSRASQMQKIDSRLARMQSVRRDIAAETEKLEFARQQIMDQRQTLKGRRTERANIVASLSESLREKNQLLNKLLRDEQHLKKLLRKIESQLEDVQLDLSPPQKFRQLKGKLTWPTTGKLAARFGSVRKNSGNLRWKGVVINTEPENAIKSVAYGRVVFADWLRGFGMLIIVDHGDGYMSLYGHNEQLHKKVGDWVQPREVIATSGRSGGQLATSVYFEIRYRGKPQDPVKWCKSLPARS